MNTHVKRWMTLGPAFIGLASLNAGANPVADWRFDGVNDYLNVGTSGNNLDLSGSFGITAWLTVRAVPSARREALIAGNAALLSGRQWASNKGSIWGDTW